MKKIGIFSLCLIILLSISGCNNNNSKTTITKEELVGTWNFYDSILTFQSDGTYLRNNNNAGTYKIIGNWLVLDDDSTLYYEYIDGKIYTTDNGAVMSKHEN